MLYFLAELNPKGWHKIVRHDINERMPSSPRKYSTGRKILIGIILLVLIAGAAFQIFIHRYLNPLVRERLEAVIVRGSDSLYTFDVRGLDVSFWQRTLQFSGMHIRIDSGRSIDTAIRGETSSIVSALKEL